MTQGEKITVYYDGECCLCNAEICHYMKKDETQQIDFVNICDTGFNAQEHGLENSDINVNLHVKSSDGQLHLGIDAFIVIWSNLPGFKSIARIVRTPIVYFFAKCGYSFFIKIRPYLPRKSKKISMFLKRIVAIKWNILTKFFKSKNRTKK